MSYCISSSTFDHNSCLILILFHAELQVAWHSWYAYMNHLALLMCGHGCIPSNLIASLEGIVMFLFNYIPSMYNLSVNIYCTYIMIIYVYIYIYIYSYLGKLQRPQPASLEMRFSNGFVPPNIFLKFGWWTTIQVYTILLHIYIHISKCFCIYIFISNF